MAKRLISFGDSFTYGSDLSDSEYYGIHSKCTWPALLANDLSREYVCIAEPGSSNSKIARQYWGMSGLINQDDLVVINWTWVDRWELWDESIPGNDNHMLADSDGATWLQQRPGDSTHQYYWKSLHSERQDKWQSLVFIQTVVQDLTSRKIPFIITCIDSLLMDQVWHCPNFVRNLQDSISPYVSWFDGKSFLDWSKSKGYAISSKLHPLEDAHLNAFEYMKNEITK